MNETKRADTLCQWILNKGLLKNQTQSSMGKAAGCSWHLHGRELGASLLDLGCVLIGGLVDLKKPGDLRERPQRFHSVAALQILLSQPTPLDNWCYTWKRRFIHLYFWDVQKPYYYYHTSLLSVQGAVHIHTYFWAQNAHCTEYHIPQCNAHFILYFQ